MSDADREKWDQRYSSSQEYVHGVEPASFLVSNRHRLPPGGKALDIACGEGQNAVYLAEEGFAVDAVDVSAVGLKKADALAARHGVSVRCQLRDIERSYIPEGPYQVIACMHYKQRDLAPYITQALAPGGVLLMELATVDNLELHKHPSRRHLVGKTEILGWFPDLAVLCYREGIFEGRALAQLVAQKPNTHQG